MSKPLQAARNYVIAELRSRGLRALLLLLLEQLGALLRGTLSRLLYGKQIAGGLWWRVQRGTTVQLYHQHARLVIGKHVFVRKNCSLRLDEQGTLLLGNYVFMNDCCTINCVARIEIGEYSKIGPGVSIYDHDHNYKGIGDSHLCRDPIVIGKNVWIGAGSIVLRGTSIGDGAVIAAGSIVRGKVDPYTLFFNKREAVAERYERKEHDFACRI